MMWKTAEGSTGRLLQLCLGYFLFYLVFLVATKYFTDTIATSVAVPEALKAMKLRMNMEFLVYSTIGGNLLALSIALAFRWYRLKSNRLIGFAGRRFPVELVYIIPSGVCTAVVIPTTTLTYTLPITVMVAMVIMRGSIIVISRVVDAIQIAQGILKKKVYLEEELGVLFAIAAVSVQFFYGGNGAGHFDFLSYTPAVIILSSYIIAYFIRLYIMNYYKNTRAKGVPQDNKGFFAIEQIVASFVIVAVGVSLYLFGDSSTMQIELFQHSLASPTAYWGWEIAAGLMFGGVAFFSVFLFMFKGRTATFSGLVNRLTSLVAGTTSTILVYFILGGNFPEAKDWESLLFILIAVGFLTLAERKRARELMASQEIETPGPAFSSTPPKPR